MIYVAIALLALCVSDARPHHFFEPSAKLDVSQVQDRRGQKQTSCVYVTPRYYCTWIPIGGRCASTCVLGD